MYTSSLETRSLRPRATLNPDSTHLPRIYHYETFAGSAHNAQNNIASNATPHRLSNVPSTPKPTTQSPRKQPPSTYKKMKTAGKAIHRLTTYWDVATHYKLMDFLRKKNIVIVGESKLLSFLSFLLLTFAFCCLYMLIASPDHNSALQNYFSNIFHNPNTTLDQLRDEAARQYEQIKKDDPNAFDDHSHSSSPSSSPSSSHPHDHYYPSAQSIYEEKLEKLVRGDLARLENQLKKLADDQTKKFNELSQSVEQKTKSLEDQQRKIVSDSNNAIANSDRTEKSFEDTRKEILSQIQKIQSDLSNVKSSQVEGSTKHSEKEAEKEKEKQKEFSDLVSKVDKLQKDVSDETQKNVVSDLQAQLRQLQSELAKPKPADNQKEIDDLKAEIHKLQKELAEVKKAPASQPASSSSQAYPELSSLTEEITQRVQALLKADVTGRVDYALHNLGARIVYDRTSPSYTRSSSSVLGNWWPIPQYFRDPSVILQQDVSPGNCWSMSGNMGHVAVKLAEPIVPGAVTIDHISPLISPDISSAPKEFTVKGLRNVTDIGTVLGTFNYDVSSPKAVQTFDITSKNQESFPIVMLSILSNHGHDNYTCIYRFRVHPQKP